MRCALVGEKAAVPMLVIAKYFPRASWIYVGGMKDEGDAPGPATSVVGSCNSPHSSNIETQSQIRRYELRFPLSCLSWSHTATSFTPHSFRSPRASRMTFQVAARRYALRILPCGN